jgi:hypothetical protein
VPRQLGVRRLMGRRNDFKPENGTLDSPYGHVSYWLYKNGQVRWEAGSMKGRTSIRKPGDDFRTAVIAALVEDSKVQLPAGAAAAPGASLVPEGRAPR